MKQAQELTLHFLGQRDYLHGTTLFETLSTQCGAVGSMSFRVSRMIESDRVAVEAFDPNEQEAGRYNASLIWRTEESSGGLGVIPLTKSAAPMRLPFDEKAIVHQARFSGLTVETQVQGEESLTKVLVALNKALLVRNLKPPMPGQWLFVRLDITRYVEKFASLLLKQRASLGFSAVASAIEVDGSELGTMVFSWVRR